MFYDKQPSEQQNNYKKMLEDNNINVSIVGDLKLNNDMITMVISSLVKIVSLSYLKDFSASYYHFLTSIHLGKTLICAL